MKQYVYIFMFFIIFLNSISIHSQDKSQEIINKIEEQVMINRETPLREMKSNVIIDVTDFGASPDNGEDDLAGINKAIRQARIELIQRNGPIEIYFPEGTYILDPYGDWPGVCLEISGLRDVTLNGNNSQILIKNPMKGFLLLNDTENIIVKDFEIDYDPLPFTQGNIHRVYNNPEDEYYGSFELLVDEGFPIPSEDKSNWNYSLKDGRCWGMLKDSDIPGRQKKGVVRSAFWAKSFEQTNENIVRIQLEKNINDINYFEEGDKYVHLARFQTMGIGRITNSKRVTFKGITAYSSPNMGFLIHNASQFNLLNSNIEIKEGRWHSINADGIFVKGGRIGPWIEGNHFEGIADDWLHINPERFFIKERVSATKLKMSSMDSYTTKIDDEFIFVNPRVGVPIYEGKVIDIDYNSNIVTFNKEIPEMEIGSERVHDHAYNKNISDNYFMIKNNVFKNSRRYPHYFSGTTSNGIIENNLYEGVEKSVLLIEDAHSYRVSQDLIQKMLKEKEEISFKGIKNYIFTENIIFRDNHIKESGFTAINRPDDAIIKINMAPLNKEESPWRGQKNIIIKNNIVENWATRQVMYISNASNLMLQDNNIINKDNPYKDYIGDSIITLENSEKIFIRNNTLSDENNQINNFVVKNSLVDNLVTHSNNIK